MSRLARGSQCDIRSGFEFPRRTEPTEAGEAKKAMSQGTHILGFLLQKGSGEPWPYRTVDLEGREGRSPTSEQKQMHGACSFCHPCAGTPTWYFTTNPPLRELAASDAGLCRRLEISERRQGDGRRVRYRGSCKRWRRKQEGPYHTTWARKMQGARNGEEGACRANEHAAQPRAMLLRLLAQEEAGDTGRPHALVPARKGCRSQHALGSAEHRLQET